MTSARWGVFLVSVGLLVSRLFGADSSTTPKSVQPWVASDAVAKAVSSEAVVAGPLTVSASLVAPAENGRAKSSAKVRRAISEGFTYDPSVRQKPMEETSPVLVRPQPLPVDPDVVVMSKMEVTASYNERELATAIANWRDPGPRNDSRYGTGMHQKDFGKVRASMVTILYVPISFGISW